MEILLTQFKIVLSKLVIVVKHQVSNSLAISWQEPVNFRCSGDDVISLRHT